MLTCISCSNAKQLNNNGSLPMDVEEEEEEEVIGSIKSKTAVKSLAFQIKGMAIKASGAYRNCKPCSGSNHHHAGEDNPDSDFASETARFHYYYRTTGCPDSTPQSWGKEGEGGLKGLSSGETTPASISGRTESVVFIEEDEPKEWVAQVEPGVLITFVSLLHGGNYLKRIRFRREMFNKWQAQRWWEDNYDKIMELYNVQPFDRHETTSPTPSQCKDEIQEGPKTPPLAKEHLVREGKHNDVAGLPSIPVLSSASVANASSVDGSARTSFSNELDHSGETSISNVGDAETEWIEQDAPGVYITIRALPDGARELRRIRFCREQYSEIQARLWWEENRERIREQYL